MLRKLATTAVSGLLFTMCQGGEVPKGCCDRGDQLNVVLHPGAPSGSDLLLCNDWGGELIFDTNNNTSTCEDVDF